MSSLFPYSGYSSLAGALDELPPPATHSSSFGHPQTPVLSPELPEPAPSSSFADGDQLIDVTPPPVKQAQEIIYISSDGEEEPVTRALAHAPKPEPSKKWARPCHLCRKHKLRTLVFCRRCIKLQ